ncbi:MAG: hypothetical protein EA425_16930 [Puniceicoccaceae bacterium]|nr:MAG: hypothetical protein EA425_16930 [Puniceicoccaceae bacterium]
MRETAPAEPLPALEAVVARVPGELVAQLEDLFRARFVRVERPTPADLGLARTTDRDDLPPPGDAASDED